MALGLAMIGALFLVTGVAGMLIGGPDRFWFFLVWAAIGLGFASAAVAVLFRRRGRD